MKTRRPFKPGNPPPIIVGTWYNADEYATGVEFIVSQTGEALGVRARDCSDGEEADIFEVAWDGEVLAFAAYWKSSGRFARYRLMALSANRIDVTYTYTDNEMFHRKRNKRGK